MSLSADPLAGLVDPRLFVPHRAVEESLAQARVAIEDHPVLLAGGPGTGKSLWLRLLGDRAADAFRVVPCPFLHIPPADLEPWLLALIPGEANGAQHGIVDRLRADPRPTLLLVDEIQSAPPETVAALVEMARECGRALRFVLAGAPGARLDRVAERLPRDLVRLSLPDHLSEEEILEELEAILAHPALSEGLRSHLRALDRTELLRASRGVPRLLRLHLEEAGLALEEARTISLRATSRVQREPRSQPGVGVAPFQQPRLVPFELRHAPPPLADAVPPPSATAPTPGPPVVSAEFAPLSELPPATSEAAPSPTTLEEVPQLEPQPPPARHAQLTAVASPVLPAFPPRGPIPIIRPLRRPTSLRLPRVAWAAALALVFATVGSTWMVRSAAGAEEWLAQASAGELAMAQEAAVAAAEEIRLNVNAVPWGEVSVDGRVLGATPLGVSMPPGRYRFEVRLADGQVLAREVDVRPGLRRVAFRGDVGPR